MAQASPPMSSPTHQSVESSTTQQVGARRKRRQNLARQEQILHERPESVVEEFDFQYSIGPLVETDSKASNDGTPAETPLGSLGKLDDGISAGAGDSSSSSAAICEVFLNVGRRDGVSSEDIAKLLAQRAVPKSAILHVSVRHHHTFVGVKRPSLHAVLSALDGASLAGRVARAEPARANRD